MLLHLVDPCLSGNSHAVVLSCEWTVLLSNLDLSNKEYLKENFSRFIISKVLYLSNKRCFQHLQSDTPKVSHTGKKPDVSKTIKKKKNPFIHRVHWSFSSVILFHLAPCTRSPSIKFETHTLKQNIQSEERHFTAKPIKRLQIRIFSSRIKASSHPN